MMRMELSPQMLQLIGDTVEEAMDHCQDEGLTRDLPNPHVVELREHLREQVVNRLRIIEFPTFSRPE